MFNATPLLKLYARYRLQKLKSYSPAAIQEEQLQNLIKTAASTRFGKEHGFSKIKTVAEYQQAVPLRRYEDFWNNYWKAVFPNITDCTWPGTIPYFPVTSGTTSGATKYIPYTSAMERSNTKAGLDLLSYHVSCKADSKIFGGRSFILGGSTELVEEAPGIFSGDLSGISVKTLPWWARARYFPPAELALLKNWEEKIHILARECLSKDIRMISGVPSWLLIFFDHLFEQYPEAERRLHKLFPNLEMIVHGGVNFAPYYEQFSDLLEGSSAELREVYPASEGFIAIADRGFREGLRLNLDHSIFYEFVPLEELDNPNPTRHWIGTIEKDINYAIVLTTCAGVWSYVIGDTVTFVDTTPPRVLITGRTSYYLSAFGEHLIADEIEDAISTAATHCAYRVIDYSVGAAFPSKEKELGKHIYVIEFESSPKNPVLEEFAQILDTRLCERNEDYAAHRAEGFGLDGPEIRAVEHGFFARWMKKRGKLGGQNKVPRIITDQELFDDLLNFTR